MDDDSKSAENGPDQQEIDFQALAADFEAILEKHGVTDVTTFVSIFTDEDESARIVYNDKDGAEKLVEAATNYFG